MDKSNFDIQTWKKEFDRFNPHPDENSDFDSDNEFNPMESIICPHETKASSVQKENIKLYKTQIQFSVIGRPNVGKSTLINSILQKERVIVSDLPGTTRDSVRVQRVYQVLHLFTSY